MFGRRPAGGPCRPRRRHSPRGTAPGRAPAAAGHHGPSHQRSPLPLDRLHGIGTLGPKESLVRRRSRQPQRSGRPVRSGRHAHRGHGREPLVDREPARPAVRSSRRRRRRWRRRTGRAARRRRGRTPGEGSSGRPRCRAGLAWCPVHVAARVAGLVDAHPSVRGDAIDDRRSAGSRRRCPGRAGSITKGNPNPDGSPSAMSFQVSPASSDRYTLPWNCMNRRSGRSGARCMLWTQSAWEPSRSSSGT